MASRRQSLVAEVLGSQEQLFRPAPPEPPSFDELCPPLPVEQLELEVAAGHPLAQSDHHRRLHHPRCLRPTPPAGAPTPPPVR
jgi:hypothetical protein